MLRAGSCQHAQHCTGTLLLYTIGSGYGPILCCTSAWAAYCFQTSIPGLDYLRYVYQCTAVA